MSDAQAKPYGDGETFEYGGAMFRSAMRMCDDCDASDRPLAWFGEHIRICEPCANIRLRHRRAERDREQAGTHP